MTHILSRLLAVVEKAIRVISVRNIALWVLTAATVIIGLTVFEFRNSIFGMFLDNSYNTHMSVLHSPSPTVQRRIKYLVDRDDLILGITLFSVDIRNNTRVPAYWYSDSRYIQDVLNDTFEKRKSGLPLFTSDDKNNAAVIASINAEFNCASFEETGSYLLYPDLERHVPNICNASIPPFFGSYSGYMSVALNRQPSEIEFDILKTDTIHLSTEIYNRDILPHISND